MILIKLYTKPGCHLCSVAKEILTRLQTEYEFILQEINIESHPRWNELYREKIPVLHINDQLVFYGRLSEKAIRRKLEELG